MVIFELTMNNKVIKAKCDTNEIIFFSTWCSFHFLQWDEESKINNN